MIETTLFLYRLNNLTENESKDTKIRYHQKDYS